MAGDDRTGSEGNSDYSEKRCISGVFMCYVLIHTLSSLFLSIPSGRASQAGVNEAWRSFSTSLRFH